MPMIHHPQLRRVGVFCWSVLSPFLLQGAAVVLAAWTTGTGTGTTHTVVTLAGHSQAFFVSKTTAQPQRLSSCGSSSPYFASSSSLLHASSSSSSIPEAMTPEAQQRVPPSFLSSSNPARSSSSSSSPNSTNPQPNPQQQIRRSVDMDTIQGPLSYAPPSSSSSSSSPSSIHHPLQAHWGIAPLLCRDAYSIPALQQQGVVPTSAQDLIETMYGRNRNHKNNNNNTINNAIHARLITVPILPQANKYKSDENGEEQDPPREVENVVLDYASIHAQYGPSLGTTPEELLSTLRRYNNTRITTTTHRTRCTNTATLTTSSSFSHSNASHSSVNADSSSSSRGLFTSPIMKRRKQQQQQQQRQKRMLQRGIKNRNRPITTPRNDSVDNPQNHHHHTRNHNNIHPIPMAVAWTLLVNDVDALVPALADALDHNDNDNDNGACGGGACGGGGGGLGLLSSFLPRWRRDDAQFSIAGLYGGVGPHIDNYDVCLLQCIGRRAWTVSTQPLSLEMEEACTIHRNHNHHNHHHHHPPAVNHYVRVLNLTRTHDDDYEVMEYETIVLEPGDVLYVPARFMHHGVSHSHECLTLSIGCRAPSARELWRPFRQVLDRAILQHDYYFDDDDDDDFDHDLSCCRRLRHIHRHYTDGPFADLLESRRRAVEGGGGVGGATLTPAVKDRMKDLIRSAVEELLSDDDDDKHNHHHNHALWFDRVVGECVTESVRQRSRRRQGSTTSTTGSSSRSKIHTAYAWRRRPGACLAISHPHPHRVRLYCDGQLYELNLVGVEEGEREEAPKMQDKVSISDRMAQQWLRLLSDLERGRVVELERVQSLLRFVPPFRSRSRVFWERLVRDQVVVDIAL